MKILKGQYNSSITRVRPVFQKLLYQSDKFWLRNLLKLFPKANPISTSYIDNSINILNLQLRKYKDRILKEYNINFIGLEQCFEFKLPPSKDFLKWLIENPDKLKVPKKEKNSENTKLKRKALIVGNMEVRVEALKELEKLGSERSSKKWWAFEGFTEVDCLIETDQFILAIEGKRTEVGPSEGVNWYSERNQIIRNIESVKQYARNKEYAVLLIDDKKEFQMTNEIIEKSIPHLNVAERTELLSHYLGSASWQEVCEVTNIDYSSLPDTTFDAVRNMKGVSI
ncbi:hypothetical protein [Leptospira sp. GIMC2001]|uniref:hypothetical protein n=1 Tax=Leptospira sp. GIMC2001 TaxID=1513297 RepID=UPI00234C0368|nr:hypothetical protein [Leptospira sp. GIMC2001]WCL50743.1 hypothetical protein O4O04_08005 [Leptospira sp. GIMC2001]